MDVTGSVARRVARHFVIRVERYRTTWASIAKDGRLIKPGPNALTVVTPLRAFMKQVRSMLVYRSQPCRL